MLHANACHVQDGQEQQMEENQARIFDHVPTEVFTKEKIKKIRIKDLDGNVHFLFPEEIIYFRSDNQNATCFNKYGSFVSRIALNQLEHGHFVRIHSKYLVNISFVKEVCLYKLTLIDGSELPIGKARYKEILDIIGMKDDE